MSAPKKVKIAFIEAAFPELASPKMYQSGKGEGGTMKVAIRNAISNLLKSRVLARKHISVIKATITITEKANNEVQRITEEPTAFANTPAEPGDAALPEQDDTRGKQCFQRS